MQERTFPTSEHYLHCFCKIESLPVPVHYLSKGLFLKNDTNLKSSLMPKDIIDLFEKHGKKLVFLKLAPEINMSMSKLSFSGHIEALIEVFKKGNANSLEGLDLER